MQPPNYPNWYPQPQPKPTYQQIRPNTSLIWLLLVGSAVLAFIAFMAFVYVGMSYISDQSNILQLANELRPYKLP